MIEVNRDGEVWVYAEQHDGQLSEVALELCGKARELADDLGVSAGAVLLGSKVKQLTGQLISQGIDRIYCLEDPRFEHYQTLPYSRSVCAAIEQYKPQIVLYGASPVGRDLAPRVASEMRAGMTADCTDLDIQDVTEPRTKQVHEKLLLQIRPAFGGNIIATIVNYDMWPQMATVREGVMPMREPDPTRTGEVLDLQVELSEDLFPIKLIERHLEARTVNLKGARVIVAGGAGVGSKANFQLIHELAGAIGEPLGPAERQSMAVSSARNIRSARPERPCDRRCILRPASVVPSSTVPVWKNRQRSLPSTQIQMHRFFRSPITGSWVISIK